MKKQYTTYDEVTKEVLDAIKKGDLVRANDWKQPMKVIGVSENYFVMTQKIFGKIFYSVCEKKRAKYGRNGYSEGQFRTAPDHWLFGWQGDRHKWEDEEWVKSYLNSFESGESKLSERKALGIKSVSIKSA